MKVENAVWDARKTPRGRGLSPSSAALRKLEVGDVKRLIHTEVVCKKLPNKAYCSLARQIHILRKTLGWKLEYYHEAEHILVIRRLE